MSRAVSLLRRPFVVALLAGAWMTALLPVPNDGREIVLSIAAVVLCMAALFLTRSHLVMASAVLFVSALVCAWLLALPYGEIELLLPVMYLQFLQGRHLETAWLGPVSALAFSLSVGIREGAPWYGVPVFLAVCLSSWILGRVVRERARVAVEAARDSAALARVDLDRVMEQSALDGRRAAASASLAVLRGAVERMAETAVRIREHGVRGWIGAEARKVRSIEVDSIRREGERAIAELHAILSLLDSNGPRIQSSDPVSEPTNGSPVAGSRGQRWMSWASWTLATLMTLASASAALHFGGANLTLLIAAVLVPVCAWLSARLPVVAGVVTGASFVLAVAGPWFPPDALLPISVCYAMLVWQLAGSALRDTRRTHRIAISASLTAAVGGAAVLGMQFGRQGVGFVLALAAIVLWAAAAWQEKEAILQTELAKVHKMTAAIAAAKARADREERQEVARELHDGVSHGITAMTLQTQAAEAYSATDPERSCLCMDLAIEIGGHTLREIDSLSPGERPTGSSAPELGTLIAGMRAVGLRVETRLVGAVDALSYRIVQEALTNIIRYAPGARVFVEVEGRDGQHRVKVVDSGACPDEAQDVPHSHRAEQALRVLGRGTGLQNLSERVRERGGSFRAAPLREDIAGMRGFEVAARWSVIGDGSSQSTAGSSANAERVEKVV